MAIVPKRGSAGQSAGAFSRTAGTFPAVTADGFASAGAGTVFALPACRGPARWAESPGARVENVMPIDPNLPVKDLVRLHPETVKVFQKYKIDLCCGGVHPLAMVAEVKNLDLAKVLREIDEVLAPTR